MTRGAHSYGLASLAADGTVLDAWYPCPELDEGAAGANGSDSAAGSSGPANGHNGTSLMAPDDLPDECDFFSHLIAEDADRGVHRVGVRTDIADLDAPPIDAYDAYLRLHLLSHRMVRPHEANLDGIFGLLANVVWTNFGPCSTEDFDVVRAKLLGRGPLTVYSIDKFPRMIDYVIPTGVRIGDADRVRLGAHLAEGTTVMHEGFVNFNAGTLGNSMVEGRISAGVVVGDGSDVGGGASIMGTLSGGGKQTISVGERCLLGANAGVGISLGDDCVVEAGLYVTAGTKCTVLLDGVRKHRKAAELSGGSNMLFRRNSQTGEVEVVPWAAERVKLNEALHKN